jgi:long-chain acyl-CoA synthetase
MNLMAILEENARLFAERTAIIDTAADEFITYRKLLSKVNTVATGLASMGIKKGDRVALYLPNGSEFIISFMAVLKLGAIVVPFNIQLKQYELEQLVEHSQPKIIIGRDRETDLEVVPFCRQVSLAPRIVKVGSNIGEGEISFQDLLAEKGEFRGVPPSDDQPAAIYYTSGTTGKMKGALLTHHNLAVTGKLNGHYLLGLNDQDRVLGISPYCHVYFMQVVLGPLSVGAAVVTLERGSPKLALQVIEKYRVTHLSTVPTMFRYLLRHFRQDKYDVASWRVAGSAATGIPLSLVKEITETFRVDFFDTYGCTETSSTITYTRLRHYQPETVGMPAHGVKVKFINDEEREVPTGTIGELVVKSPGVFKGYWRDPQKTQESFTGAHWFKTGDLGYRDRQGNIYIVGRKKEVIMSGGYNIYPWEVERILLCHPQVADAAVAGRPDPDLGEIPVGYVVLKPGSGLREQELIDFCHRHLARYKCPRTIVFVDSLPRSDSGKVLKKLLS